MFSKNDQVPQGFGSVSESGSGARSIFSSFRPSQTNNSVTSNIFGGSSSSKSSDEAKSLPLKSSIFASVPGAGGTDQGNFRKIHMNPKFGNPQSSSASDSFGLKNIEEVHHKPSFGGIENNPRPVRPKKYSVPDPELASSDPSFVINRNQNLLSRPAETFGPKFACPIDSSDMLRRNPQLSRGKEGMDFVHPEMPPPLNPVAKRKRPQEDDREGSPKKLQTSKSRPTPAAVSKELNQLKRIRAETDEERWNLLKEVDNLLYKGQDDREEDANLQGICKDMCPEKERYGRSFKNQLRVYEKTNGELDHRLAVKEHSRSAADQEIPPPTELRTLKALTMTMDHLIHNVVSRQDLILDDVQEAWSQIPLSEWYLFVWSSTRAIRKEVTQQNLFSSQGLDILMKILRFHIVCNEEMANESNFSFDRKLNDENAIKCLKTITQMIEDGVQCSNEPEVRSYEILYNLNDGQVLLAVSKLSQHLRNHQDVRFAIRLHSAVGSANPVAFFKLMKRASYLQACILKRYVYQMRLIALKLTRVYVPGKSMMELPMSKFMDWLYFDESTECGKFLRSHGFEFEEESVFVERSSFNPPEEIANQGSSNLIRAKMDCPLENFVNGGPLGLNPLLKLKPHHSFSEDGFLLQDLNESVDTTLNSSVDTFLNEEVGDEEEIEETEEYYFAEPSDEEFYEEEEEEEEDLETSNYEEDERNSTEEAPQETDPATLIVENFENEYEVDKFELPRHNVDTSQETNETVDENEEASDSEQAEEELVEEALDTVMRELTEELVSLGIAKEKKMIEALNQCPDVMEQLVEELIIIETKKVASEVQDELHDFIERHEKFVLESLLETIIKETSTSIVEEHNKESAKKYFSVWRRNARASSMKRKGFQLTNAQDFLESYCYTRIVKFILTQHGHRSTRNLPSPHPAEIISFINSELDHILEDVLVDEGKDILLEEISKFKLPIYQAPTQMDMKLEVAQLFHYLDTLQAPGLAILRSNVERLVRDVTKGHLVNLPYLHIFSEIFCHQLLYQQMSEDVSRLGLWARIHRTPPQSFVFSSPTKRKTSPTLEEVNQSPKRPRPSSKVIQAAEAELTKCKRFENLLQDALDDDCSVNHVPSTKRRKDIVPSIETLKYELEEEMKRSSEFERKLQMYL